MTLEDVCTRITDGAHSSPPSVSEGKPMASVKDLTPFGIRLETCRQISDQDFEQLVRQGCQPCKGDVLLAKDGATALDTVCEVKRNDEVVLLSSVAILRPNSSVIHSGYLHYYLDASTTRSYLKKSFISGAAIPRVVLKDLKRAAIRVPPLPFQRRIAGILSAYDELIENNQRRIKILEEMARSLYREWFVHFRFPGHDKVDWRDTQFGNVPSEWAVPFADYVDFKEGPGLRNWQYRDSGIPFLNIRTLVDNDIDLSKVQFVDKAEAEGKYQHFLLKEHDHVVSSSGTIGRLVTIRAEHLPLMLNTSIIRMRPVGRRIGRWQLKHFLLSDYFQNQAKSFAIGAAQPNFGPSHLKQMQILAASEEVGAIYERLVEPMELAIMSLAGRMTNLRRTRDLLLPRLLSGQLLKAVS